MSTLRNRLGDESGFTMAVALGVLTVTTLLMAAAFVAAQGDIGNSQRDLDGKRAYYSARAGLNTFLYRLNKNTELWQSCPTQASNTIPGAGAGSTQKYSYKPLPANGKPACSTSDPVHTMIDITTGSFRMQFTGTSGNPAVSRTIVASFRRNSTLDYLYYSVYETLDPNAYSNPANYQDCAKLLRNGRNASKCGTISWISGDKINGPLYTQDQYSICGSPTFGRSGGSDTVNTPAPKGTGLIPTSGCSQNAVLNGKLVENAQYITPPPDNSSLKAYAQSDGKIYNGQTWVTLNGNTATVVNNNSTTTVNLAATPIIYVNNSSSCTNATYTPYSVSYPATNTVGGCGTVYVSGNYTTSATIAAANDVVISGNVTTDLNGSAVLGLVANNFVRIKHGVTSRSGNTAGACGSASNISSQTLSSPRIDAAVLALNHSFIVDNYDCGAAISGSLTVNGAIAQLFRGTVGTTSNGNPVTGYLKNYNYDDRLAVQQPPFLFDLAIASWRVTRETSCVDGGAAAVAC